METMVAPKRNWVDMLTEMLYSMERETKFTLRGLNDNFKQLGLSFDVDFRNHFLQIILKRVSKTYDQFTMNLEFEELRTGFDESAMDGRVFSIDQLQMANRPYVAEKRKTPDESDVNEQIYLIKRPRVDEGVKMNEEYKSHSEAEDFGSEPDEDDAIVESNIVNADDDDKCIPTMAQSDIHTARDMTNEQAKVVSRKAEEPAILSSIATNAASKSIVESASEVPIDVDNIEDAVPQIPKFPSNTKSKGVTRTNPKIESEVKANDHQPKLPLALRPAPASVKEIRMRELKETDTQNELSATKSAFTQDDNTPKGASNDRSNKRRPPKKLFRISSNTENLPMHKCNQCDYQSEYLSNLKRHIGSHEKPFRCSRCTKFFADQELLDMHMKCHENRCIKCGKRFSKAEACKEHEKRCIQLQPKNDQSTSCSGNKENRPMHKCEQCDYQSEYRSCVKRHMVKHKRPFSCSRCLKFFKDQDLLDVHMKCHENQCSKCKRKYDAKLPIEEHEKHCNRRQYQCYLCKYHSSRKFCLFAHMRKKHTGDMPIKCEQCSYMTTIKFYLDRHQKRAHQN
ncbi:zinc finger protein 391-like [Contarinia nasturtii]|uniref:zinc finger protein 391-like n=1 Tax=Contarinia nasturtii TaxID=265458 RepID=UPI0012D45A70|nr:zinc finger protein 391-like [Contarinia nasturtii]